MTGGATPTALLVKYDVAAATVGVASATGWLDYFHYMPEIAATMSVLWMAGRAVLWCIEKLRHKD